MERGAVEAGAGHYPLLVIMHAAWLIGLWALAWNRSVQPLWLLAFIALQALRIWVIATLGERWTTRIIILPGAPLVAKGPYRYLSHPNYAVVAAEIAALPLAFGLPAYAALFTALNAAVLFIRIRAENEVLRQAGAPHPPFGRNPANGGSDHNGSLSPLGEAPAKRG